MLINIYMYDLCYQATLLYWTILGTENEQLTLLQLFHEVLPLCMLILYHVSYIVHQRVSASPWNDTEELYPQCESCYKKSKIPNVEAQRKKNYKVTTLSMFYMVMSQ